MHGFIDLIFQRDGKFYVADYKSSFLGEQLADYGHEAMQASIHSNSYDVQYLIYALALHRYLKVRLSNYQPAAALALAAAGCQSSVIMHPH